MEQTEKNLDSTEMDIQSKDITFNTTMSYLSDIADTDKNYLKTTEEAKEWTRHNPNSCLPLIRTRYVNILTKIYGDMDKFHKINELKSLIVNGEYREFQRRIGCPISKCDGRLGKETMKYLDIYVKNLLGENADEGKQNNEQVEQGHSITEQVEQGHPITEQEFNKYFSGESFRQSNMQNCRLVAAVDSLVGLGQYKELIFNNVRCTENGFIFRMPLRTKEAQNSEVKGNFFHEGDEYIVTKDMYSGEKSKRGRLNLLSGKEGHKALAYVLGRLYTGHDNFSYEELQWLGSGEESPLEYAVYPTVSERKEKLLDESFPLSLENLLGNFNSKTDMMTIGVQQGDGYSELLPGDLFYGRGHIVSIEKTRYANGRLMVRISNPWNAGMYYDISFSKLKDCATSYNWASLNINANKDKKIKGPNDEKLEKAKNAGDGKRTSMKRNIEMTGRYRNKLQNQRDLKIYEHESKKIYTVESRGSSATNIELLKDSVKFSVSGHKNISVTIPNDKFLSTNENDLVDKSLYIANFINKMAYDYIKPQKAKKNYTGPFEWKKGKGLEFQHKVDSLGGVVRGVLKSGNVQVLTEKALRDTFGVGDINGVGDILQNWFNQLYKGKVY